MKILGFNFTKINAEKNLALNPSVINTNIEFLDFEKDSAEMLKDQNIVKVSFKFDISYLESQDKKENLAGKLSFEGVILLSAEKKDPDLVKEWKKKEVNEEIKVKLLNIIIKKCSAKALTLEEELDMPPHIPLPRISVKDKKE